MVRLPCLSLSDPSGFQRIGFPLADGQIQSIEEFVPHGPGGAERGGELVIGGRGGLADEGVG